MPSVHLHNNDASLVCDAPNTFTGIFMLPGLKKLPLLLAYEGKTQRHRRCKAHVSEVIQFVLWVSVGFLQGRREGANIWGNRALPWQS